MNAEEIPEEIVSTSQLISKQRVREAIKDFENGLNGAMRQWSYGAGRYTYYKDSVDKTLKKLKKELGEDEHEK